MTVSGIRKHFALNTARGISIVEAVITLPVFLLLILAFIDICRYLLISIFLNFAAHQAIDDATKSEVEVELSQAYCTANAANLAKCQNYFNTTINRIVGVSSRAQKTALLVASAPGTNSLAVLENFTMYESSDYPPATYPGQWIEIAANQLLVKKISPIGFMRPGEAVKRENLTKIWHPTRGELQLKYWPTAVETWQTVLETEPLAVQIEAKFTSLLGILFPPITISAPALGFRKTGSFGLGRPPPPPSSTPTATATGTPTPTVTATSTATTAPTSTNTATQTSTPTITNTATNTGTATQTGTPTNTGTSTSTPTITNTPTNTGTATQTGTATNTRTSTSTPTITNTPTNTGTATQTGTATNTRTSTSTPTITNTPTNTGTATNTNTPTQTGTSTNTATATGTATITATPTLTATATNTATQTATATNAPTATSTRISLTCDSGVSGQTCNDNISASPGICPNNGCNFIDIGWAGYDSVNCCPCCSGGNPT